MYELGKSSWKCIDVQGAKKEFCCRCLGGFFAQLSDSEICVVYVYVGSLCRTDCGQGSRVRVLFWSPLHVAFLRGPTARSAQLPFARARKIVMDVFTGLSRFPAVEEFAARAVARALYLKFIRLAKGTPSSVLSVRCPLLVLSHFLFWFLTWSRPAPGQGSVVGNFRYLSGSCRKRVARATRVEIAKAFESVKLTLCALKAGMIHHQCVAFAVIVSAPGPLLRKFSLPLRPLTPEAKFKRRRSKQGRQWSLMKPASKREAHRVHLSDANYTADFTSRCEDSLKIPNVKNGSQPESSKAGAIIKKQSRIRKRGAVRVGCCRCGNATFIFTVCCVFVFRRTRRILSTLVSVRLLDWTNRALQHRPG